MSMPRNLLPAVSAAFLVLLGAFGAGFLVGNYQVWPYEVIADMRRAAASLIKYGGIFPEQLLVERPEHASGQRVTITDGGAVTPGYRAIMGHDIERGQYAVWLLDSEGKKLHAWHIDYLALDPDGPTEDSDQPHGLAVMEDGSIIVNFDHGDIMARLDACGDPVWVREGVFHHSLDRDADGSFWVWEGLNTAYAHHHYLTNFDADTGETRRRIDFLKTFVESRPGGRLAFSVPEDFVFREFEQKPGRHHDLFHPNDLEVLTADLAGSFPDFETGDLLISLRTLHMVAVLDPDSGAVKWASRSPWRFQHDPDFRPDGTISVYDNNTDLGQSAIVVIDPRDNSSRLLYDDGRPMFYSPFMGKHQALPGGHYLIVSPDEGRVIETDADGQIVFEFNNIYSDRYNVHVQNAVWMPGGYFTSMPSCSRD